MICVEFISPNTEVQNPFFMVFLTAFLTFLTALNQSVASIPFLLKLRIIIIYLFLLIFFYVSIFLFVLAYLFINLHWGHITSTNFQGVKKNYFAQRIMYFNPLLCHVQCPFLGLHS